MSITNRETTTVGPMDDSGPGWRRWHDAGLDCTSTRSSTRTWDVRSFNTLRVQVCSPSVASPPAFTISLLSGLDGSHDQEAHSPDGDIQDTNLSSDGDFMSPELDVSGAAYARVAPTTAAGTALELDVIAYASDARGFTTT